MLRSYTVVSPKHLMTTVNHPILEIIPHKESYGLDMLMLDIIKAGRNATVKQFNGSLDIGCPDDGTQAIDEFESKKDIFLKE